MTILDWAAVLFCGAAISLHLATCGLCAYRVTRSKAALPLAHWPPVTILRPVCGRDNHDALTLKSGFELSHPDYELIFCCAREDDPVIPLVRGLMAQFPQVNARLLIGYYHGTGNPKLDNLVKGWRASDRDWVVMADSNVLMPADYLHRLLREWREDTGLVCSPPIGCMPEGFWAELECAFLNGYQARWQYVADAIGLGFAQGKSMLWRRQDLDKAGGILALGAEIAEDAAATKVVRESGLRVRLVPQPFEQPLGARTAQQVWSRQLRWARLRRATFPAFFVPELFAGALFPLMASLYAAGLFDIDPVLMLSAFALIWFGSEAALVAIAGWRFGPASLLAWGARDLLLPVLWVQAWLDDRFTWRGNEMRLSDAAEPRNPPIRS